MAARMERVTHVYRCVVAGACPGQDAADAIRSGVCVPGEDTCVCVSLVDTLVRVVSSEDTTVPCERLLRVLFQDMDLMTHLVHLFHSEDQIISHLAAKSASSYVVFHLLKSGTVCPVWQQKCVQTFHSSVLGAELDCCLWSVTEVLKRLLKAAHREILGNLVSVLDSSVVSLCSELLPEEKERWKVEEVGGACGTTLCLLLDLLEALTASAMICGSALRSQRLVHLRSSSLLDLISSYSSSEGFVRRRALLLLKRTLLQRAGEDWASGGDLQAERKHQHFDSDMNQLAHSVLSAVAADWLLSVQVDSVPSFFGGAGHTAGGDKGQKPDSVMLRAVSMIILKSTEIHTQTSGRAAGVDGAVDLSGTLQRLWSFLRRSSVLLRDVPHLCCWVSVLFGEQDDDMMEAAKALLAIFLHHRSSSSTAELDAACDCGFNPHCHFLFLLQSVSFDHSILLDFLISTETCFLEYLVRYLKLLAADWSGFTAACGRVAHSDVSHPDTLTHSGSQGGEEEGVQFHHTDATPASELVSAVAGLRLVDYDSSDESDQERMETSEPSVGQRTKTSTCRDRTIGQKQCEVLSRAVSSLSRLRQVVTRLRKKNLFPYNPSSLLKLLAQVENCSQHPPLSHINK